ncbi:MAG: SDR family oxidoreductase [Thermoplasmata archaeon]|nr:SDR family oxidoreductase [Thermoplasmata archaeon]MCI4359299.1 SDR family oxidoreductase [Thermoplasmata archaeon]
MEWKGKVVLVAGVGGGLGSALVQVLCSAGATTIAVARRTGSLSPLEALARAQGWSFRSLSADLGRPAEVGRVFERVTDEFGPLDGLSVNAGHWVVGDPLLHKSSDDEWTKGLSDNLDPMFFVCRAALPAMIARGRGAIVLVSATERVRYSGNASYCASKGALVDLGAKLAHDYRSSGIRVNVVLPGSMEHDVDVSAPPQEAATLRLRDQSGVGAWEVARTIRFLLSDEARWVSGAAVRVDGGFSTHGKEQPSVGVP